MICLLLGGFVELEAQTPRERRVQRHQQGFEVLKTIDGEDVLLAYSETGDFDRAIHTNPVFRKMIDTFGKASHRPFIRLAPSNDLPEEVPPLCTDIWTQDEPNHNLTPIIDSTHCKVGCVATAMTQVMYYYKYPERGMGSHTYFDEKGCKDTLTADFSAHTYEWEYMLDTYEGINYSERQVQAIALLSSDCGISVNMQYGVDASGAQSIWQPYAFYNYFGYDPGMRMIYRDFYRRDEQHQLIRTELAAGHPVTCSAHSSDGGHAFVIDGYDRNGLYHINWGWGGWCDGYYNIDYMNPNQPEWGHFPDRIENGLNLLQGFVLGIQPKGPKPNPETHEYAFSHIELLNDSALVVHNLCNVGWNIHDGRVALAITNADNDNIVAIAYDYNRQFLLEEFEDTTYTDTIAFADIAPQFAPLADATYRLMPMFEDNGEWHHARTSCGTPYYIYVDKQGQTIRPHEAHGAIGHLQLIDFICPDTVTRGKYASMSITLANDTDDEYCGRIFLCRAVDPNSALLQPLTQFGLYITPHATQTIDLDYIYISSRLNDTVRLHVLYDVDLFTDSLIHFDTVKEVMVADKPSSIQTLSTDQTIQTKQLYDPSGKPVNKLLPHQIIISNDGKKRSIQNVP